MEVDITTHPQNGPSDGGARRRALVAKRRGAKGPRDQAMTASIGRRIALTWLGFGAGAILVCLAAPLMGSTSINLRRAFDTSIPFADNLDAQIFFVARLPRVLAGAMVGSSLAASGVVFQALLRNPLATPFTLGVSAGAALGAMLAVTLNLPSGIAGFSAVPIASFAGALGAVAIVYGLARAKHRGHFDQRAAARRRHAELVLLGADSVRAVHVRLHADVPHGPLADGRSGREQLCAARSPRCRPSRCRSRRLRCCRNR